MIQNKTETEVSGRDAVSPVIGFVLIIAISAMALTLLQVAAVPVWNEGVEFDHSQEVKKSIQELRSDTIHVSSTGRTSVSNIELGTQYPRRFVFLNPPPSSGTVSTSNGTSFVLENVVATDTETADYWNGTTKKFPTKSIVYEPDYNVLNSETSIVYESAGSVVYNEQRGNQAPLSDTVLVSGKRITIVSTDGTLSKSGTGVESLDLKPVSAPYTSVSVTNNGTENITVTVPTRLSEEKWGSLLEDETAENGGYVADYSVNNGELTLDLLSEIGGEKVEYSLRTSKVGVGSGIGEEEAHYMTAPEGTYLSSKRVVVKVLDRYNNPVGGVEVGFDSDDNDLSADTATTESDGVAEVTHLGASPTTVRASMAGRESSPDFDKRTKEDIEFEVSVTGGGGGGGNDGDINPNDPGSLVLRGAEVRGCSTGPGKNKTVECESRMTFKNTNNIGTLKVVEARINFYSVDNSQAQGATQRLAPKTGVLEGTSLDIGGPFETVSMSFSTAGSGLSKKSVEFYENGDEYRIRDGDFYVLTLVFQGGDKSVYFVSPEIP